MNPHVIQFACNHCHSWLTVPAHLAGVAGPCPKCGQHIVSPLTSQAPPAAAPAPVAPQAPQAQGMPWSQRPPTGGLIAPTPPENAWGIPPVVPGAPLPIMPSVPLAPPAPPAEQAAPQWGAPQNQPLPSVAMQPSLLRQAMPTPAPQMPPNPIADALKHLPQQNTPPFPSPTPGPNSPLSRPATIGGSRLSLLARQLTNSADGSLSPPEHPPRMEAGPRQALPQQPPDAYASRQTAASQQMLQQAVPRGAGHSHRSRSKGGGGKLAFAALFIALGLAVAAYAFRDNLRVVWERAMPPHPELPLTNDEPTPAPRPGIDPAPDAVAHATTPASATLPPTIARPAQPAETPPPRALPVSNQMLTVTATPPLLSESVINPNQHLRRPWVSRSVVPQTAAWSPAPLPPVSWKLVAPKTIPPSCPSRTTAP